MRYFYCAKSKAQKIEMRDWTHSEIKGNYIIMTEEEILFDSKKR